jgi:DNA-binding PadR family transcriptional regulator
MRDASPDGGIGKVRPEVAEHLPLRPEILFMLLAMSRAAWHGYGLIEAVETESKGEVRIQTGSLYRFIGQLEDEGLIEEVPEPAGIETTDERRRYYMATPLGREVGQAELSRLRRLVAAAELATNRG